MSDGLTFSTSRRLPFTPAAIYGAFRSASLLAAWWGPDGFTNTFEQFHFHVGGRWHFVMHGPGGQDYANQNVFVELIEDRKVVIRHACAPLFTLTVTLTPIDGDATHLTWDQTFDDAAFARAVESIVVPANEQNLDRLTHVLKERTA